MRAKYTSPQGSSSGFGIFFGCFAFALLLAPGEKNEVSRNQAKDSSIVGLEIKGMVTHRLSFSQSLNSQLQILPKINPLPRSPRPQKGGMNEG